MTKIIKYFYSMIELS